MRLRKSCLVMYPLSTGISNPSKILYKSATSRKIGKDNLYLFFCCRPNANLNTAFASDCSTVRPCDTILSPHRNDRGLIVESAHSDHAITAFLKEMYSLKSILPSKSLSAARIKSLASVYSFMTNGWFSCISKPSKVFKRLGP